MRKRTHKKPRNRGLKPVVLLTPDLGFPLLVSSTVTRKEGVLTESFRYEYPLEFIAQKVTDAGVVRFRVDGSLAPDWVRDTVRNEFLKGGAR